VPAKNVYVQILKRALPIFMHLSVNLRPEMWIFLFFMLSLEMRPIISYHPVFLNPEWKHKGAVVFMATHCFECLFCAFVLEVVICLFRAILDCGQICMAVATSMGGGVHDRVEIR
jgi:hypothetical protein